MCVIFDIIRRMLAVRTGEGSYTFIYAHMFTRSAVRCHDVNYYCPRQLVTS